MKSQKIDLFPARRYIRARPVAAESRADRVMMTLYNFSVLYGPVATLISPTLNGIKPAALPIELIATLKPLANLNAARPPVPEVYGSSIFCADRVIQ